MKIRISIWWLLAGSLAMLLVLSACGEKQRPAEEVTYRLKWLFNISVVGDLALTPWLAEAGV